MNTTLVERYNKPAIGREWRNWVSIGESYAAGPGAGDFYGDGGGGRRKGAYPAQLDVSDAFREGHGSPEFRFAACSASSTTEGGCNGDGVSHHRQYFEQTWTDEMADSRPDGLHRWQHWTGHSLYGRQRRIIFYYPQELRLSGQLVRTTAREPMLRAQLRRHYPTGIL